ncbi:MAG: hypothetical protein HYR94_13630 [Chloroflexi bacterium]|nr:hypothetical protein [Chloroflexota bacterium]
MAKQSYAPLASYAELKRVEGLIHQAQTVDDIRKIVDKDGPKVGYKAFCYMLTSKMTAEALKPDEACVAAARLEQEGKADDAIVIYKKVLEAHPDHPLAKGKA